ncbi:MAG: response regulator [Candidatus Hodarchaeales archaeon]
MAGAKQEKKGTKSLLLVEDDAHQAEIVKLYILDRHPDLLIVIAEDGKKAVEKIRSITFDIIILDYQVPELSGLEIMDEINSILSHVPPIIFMTGYGSEEIAVEAMKRGARDYVIKRLNFHKKVNDIVSHILASEPTKTISPLQIENLCLAVYTIGSLGPNVLELDKQDCPNELKSALSMIGVYYYTAIGQGKAHHLGLFGPLPVPGSIAETHSSLAYTTLVKDKKQTDPRMKGKSYLLMSVLYPSDYRSLFYDQDSIRTIFDESFHKINDVSEISYKFVLDMKKKLFKIISKI